MAILKTNTKIFKSSLETGDDLTHYTELHYLSFNENIPEAFDID